MNKIVKQIITTLKSIDLKEGEFKIEKGKLIGYSDYIGSFFIDVLPNNQNVYRFHFCDGDEVRERNTLKMVLVDVIRVKETYESSRPDPFEQIFLQEQMMVD